MDSDSNIIIKEEITEILVEPVVPFDAFDSEGSAEDSDIDSKSDFINENPSTSYASNEYALDDTGKLIRSSSCDEAIKNENIPSKHLKLEHPSDINRLKCYVCEQTLPTLQSFKLHFHNVHQGAEQTIRKHLKDARTNDKDRETPNTNQQKELCEETDKKPFACKLCKKCFVSTKSLYNHERISHPPPSAAKKCAICDKQFKTKFHMDIHIRTVHDKGLHYCDICHKQCNSRRYLLKHRKTHNDTRYDCEVCPKTYKSKDELRRHTKKYHLIGENWSVDSTNSSNHTTNSSVNQEFIDITHLEDTKCEPKPKKNGSYKCPSCERIFTSRYSLRDHKRNVHAPPEAAKDCEICHKNFKSIHHLKIHIRHIHDDSSHACDLCQKEFKSRNYMMKHRRTHIDTQFSCSLCPKVFKCKDSVTKHVKRVHILPCSFENYDEDTGNVNLDSNLEDVNLNSTSDDFLS